MAEFTSRYEELMFYVDDKPHKFTHNRFVTEDPAVIAVLEGIEDAERVDVPDDKPASPRKRATAAQTAE